MNLVLIGYRGCGKSTVGRLLARRLGWPFVDTDAIIEERTGQTIRELFTDREGEAFRAIESQVVAEVAGLDHHVISTGGGAILRPGNAEALKRTGKLVWLKASAETAWERILADTRRQTTRPPIDFARGLQDVRAALAERLPLYERWADVIVDTEQRSAEVVVERILTRAGLRHESRD